MSQDRGITKSAPTMRPVNTETYLLSDHSVGQTPPLAISPSLDLVTVITVVVGTAGPFGNRHRPQAPQRSII